MEVNSGKLTGKEWKFGMLMCVADVSYYAIKPDSDADRSCCEDYSTSWILCQHLSAIHMVATYRKHFYTVNHLLSHKNPRKWCVCASHTHERTRDHKS